MTINYPFFVFSMQLDTTPQLNQGRLVLYDWERGNIGRWVATSGLGQYQKIGGWSKQGGGVLPATYQCNPTFANYWMTVSPVDRSDVKGIEGNAYGLNPYAVRTKEGIERSDLMVHRDANVPGSMGCIVLPTDEFADFEATIARELVGHEQVKLWVQYDF